MDLSEVNYVKVLLATMAISFTVLSLVLHLFRTQTSSVLARMVGYGKVVANEKRSFLSKEVPKARFKHYYRVAIVFHSLSLYFAVSAYVFNKEVPQYVISALDILCGHGRVSAVSNLEALIGVVLMSSQVYRRFYDTHFVCVFSKTATMDKSQYIMGLTYYPMVAISILSEAPKFDGSSSRGQQGINWSDVTIVQIIAVLLFYWGWYHQFTTTAILANLRKDKKGGVVSDKYKIPEGDWFKYLSSPHLTTEIIMYSAITVILWSHSGWWYVYALVMANQIESIYSSHKWYKDTFKNFPKSRKAFIPFLF